jgi:hypothetical protein
MPCSSLRQVNKRKQPGKSSRFFGVSWYAPKDRPDRRAWRASIKIAGKTVTIGEFHTELEAAKAYLEKAAHVYGQPVRLDDAELIKAGLIPN